MERRGSQHSHAPPLTPTRSSNIPASIALHGRTKSLGTFPFSPNSTPGGGAGTPHGISGMGSPGGVPMSPAKSHPASHSNRGSMVLPPGMSIPGLSSPGPSSATWGGGGGGEMEWSDIQARTFCRWLNTKLEAKGLEPMTDLGKDFSSGVKLIELLEIMSDQSLGRYNKKPIMRVQKAENASKALQFIRDSGVKLTNIGPEDIVDGNLKLILGMIWTLILRFTIATITEEGLSAKDGLLLWCQRKTSPYREVQINNFKQSFGDGLALPELLDYDALNKDDRRGNTELALKVAEEALGIPRLLEVKDLCDVDVPDERSVMTYVAEFFHRFAQEDKMETGTRRVEKFAELLQGILNDFERRMTILLRSLGTTQAEWASSAQASSYPDAMASLAQFSEYKKTHKRAWVKERKELAQLYSNIQTKLKTYALRPWEPEPGLRLEDLEAQWAVFLDAEGKRSRAINARIREIKEALRKEFAMKAEDFIGKLKKVEQGIGALQGPLSDQKRTLLKLAEVIPVLHHLLSEDIAQVDQRCLEAKVEENDYTVLTLDDLEYELELAESGIRKKIAFVENQMVSATHTNITPAKLEEFESTFKHFDKDDTNTLMLWEMNAALASLGIVYAEEDLASIYGDLERGYGAVTFEAWLGLLTDITKDDSSSLEQLKSALRGMAGDKPYLTEIDFVQAHLPKETIRFLTEVIPSNVEGAGRTGGQSSCSGEVQYDSNVFSSCGEKALMGDYEFLDLTFGH